MEQLIHSLDFYGVLVESFMIIFSFKKLFTQITIATILPLSLLSLCQAQFSHLLFPINEEDFKNEKWDSFWCKEVQFCLFKIVYIVFFLLLSMLSTSAVVYAVARVYTAKEVCFTEVVRVVPKVWRRVMVTFAWSFLFVFLYNMAAFSLLSPFSGTNTGRIAVPGPTFVIYVMGFVYMSIVWHLASVVAVLEEDCGVEAMVRGNGMVRGKMGITVGVFLVLYMCFISIQVVFERFVVVGGGVGWRRVGWGVGCLLLLCGFTLLGLVVQTVVYFVCKMYHLEASSNHSDQKFGDYDPLGCNELDRC